MENWSAQAAVQPAAHPSAGAQQSADRQSETVAPPLVSWAAWRAAIDNTSACPPGQRRNGWLRVPGRSFGFMLRKYIRGRDLIEAECARRDRDTQTGRQSACLCLTSFVLIFSPVRSGARGGPPSQEARIRTEANDEDPAHPIRCANPDGGVAGPRLTRLLLSISLEAGRRRKQLPAALPAQRAFLHINTWTALFHLLHTLRTPTRGGARGCE